MAKKKKIAIASEEEVEKYGQNEKSAPQEEKNDRPETEKKESPQTEDAQPTQEPISETEEWKEKFLRAKAELLNYQRRAEKDRSETLKFANAGLAKALLPIIEDLERVLSAETDQNTNAQTISEGVKLTLDNFLKVLRQFNIVPIEAAGKPFDPKVHEAVMENPSAEHPQRMVLEEVVKGYQLHDRVLRPAKVIVSKQSEKSDPDEKKETAADETESAKTNTNNNNENNQQEKI